MFADCESPRRAAHLLGQYSGHFAKTIIRQSDFPLIETVLLDRKDLPSAGAGECPMIRLGPAIANAIFDATGVRLRSLPLGPDDLKLT